MIIQLSRILHVLGTHELMCRKSCRMVKLRISVSEMISILKRVFQLVSILHGTVIITLQTVSHFAVQRVNCVMMLAEATMVIAKGRTTNLGRGGVWNSVHFLPLFFHTWFPPIYFLSAFLRFLCLSPYLFLLDLFFISYLLFFLLYTLVYLQVCLISLFVYYLLLFFLFGLSPCLFWKPRHSSDANTGRYKVLKPKRRLICKYCFRASNEFYSV